MKIVKKIVPIVCTVAVLAGCLAAMYWSRDTHTEQFGVQELDYYDLSLCDDITDMLDFPYEVSVKDGKKFQVHEGGIVTVTDENDRVLWQNAPATYQNNPITVDEGEQQSPVSIEYHYNREQSTNMFSGPDSVDLEQSRVYLDGEKVLVEYMFGEFSDQELAPMAFTKDRFENEILVKLDEEDVEYLLRRYELFTLDTVPRDLRDEMLDKVPGIQDQELYLLTDGDSNVKRARISSIVESAGYTKELYAEDAQITQEKLATNQEVYHMLVEYAFDGQDVVVNIPGDQIQFSAANPLVSFDFAANASFGTNEDTGYYMLPVNSGVLQNLGGVDVRQYSISYMGINLVEGMDDQERNNDIASFPVYGYVNGQNGYLAIIEEGQEMATLHLETAPNASVLYPSFKVLENADISRIANKKSPSYGMTAYEGDYRIRYRLLSQDEADYSSMANIYRQYLIDNGTLTLQQDGSRFLLECIGNICTEESFRGLFQYESVNVMTTFAQCQEMLDAAVSKGVQAPAVKLSGFNENGLFAQSPLKYVYEEKLGSDAERESFFANADENNVAVFLDVNLAFNYDKGAQNGYVAKKMNAKFPDRSLASVLIRSISSGMASTKASDIHIVSPKRYEEIAKGYQEQLRVGLGISIGDSTNYLNSDFNSESYSDKSDAAQYMQNALNQWTGRQIMAKSPQSNLLASLDMIDELPINSDSTFGFSEFIPFTAMVLHGYVDYTTPAINTQLDYSSMVLQALEYGSIPKFTLAYTVPADIGETEYDYLYNVSYDEWKDIMVEEVLRIQTTMDGLWDQPIVSHSILGDVHKTVYGDKAIIYVNYGAEDCVEDGVTVPAGGFVRVEQN